MPADTTLNYTAVVLAGIISFGLVVLLFLLASLIAPKRRTSVGRVPYESGIAPSGEGWRQLNLRYYLFAVFFLIFDIEAVFLFPWALTFLDIGATAFFEMIAFLSVLFLGLVYAWRKGVLQWR